MSHPPAPTIDYAWEPRPLDNFLVMLWASAIGIAVAVMNIVLLTRSLNSARNAA